MSSLKSIQLSGTQVTDADTADLKKALPRFAASGVQQRLPAKSRARDVTADAPSVPEVGRDAAIAEIEKLGGKRRYKKGNPKEAIEGVYL